MNLIKRIAIRHLQAQAGIIQSVDNDLSAVSDYAAMLEGELNTMNALIAKGEARRLGRITDLKVRNVRRDGNRITGEVQSARSGETYPVHITLAPQRGHHCTCPDWQKRGRKVGPCKHVLALGHYWKNEMLLPAMETLRDGLIGILEKATF